MDITPPLGIYTRMWGAALHDCATEIHRPLLAQALAIAGGGEAKRQFAATKADGWTVVLTIDCCVMQKKETEEVIAAVCSATSLAREQVRRAEPRTLLPRKFFRGVLIS